jgi:cysteine desulfuration protein SufE
MTFLETIRQDFEFLATWEERYSYIIDLGKALAPYPEEFRNDAFLVKGCQSNVWLHATYIDGTVNLVADSDAIIVRGLVAIVLGVFNHRTPVEILASNVEIVKQLGLGNHLSMNRTNGLAAMEQEIRKMAMAFSMKGLWHEHS